MEWFLDGLVMVVVVVMVVFVGVPVLLMCLFFWDVFFGGDEDE